MAKEAVGQRGKTAEKEVELVLRKFNGKSGFAYLRLQDSRSARSVLSAQPADFLYFAGDNAGFIEVKSTQHS